MEEACLSVHIVWRRFVMKTNHRLSTGHETTITLDDGGGTIRPVGRYKYKVNKSYKHCLVIHVVRETLGVSSKELQRKDRAVKSSKKPHIPPKRHVLKTIMAFFTGSKGNTILRLSPKQTDLFSSLWSQTNKTRQRFKWTCSGSLLCGRKPLNCTNCIKMGKEAGWAELLSCWADKSTLFSFTEHFSIF